MSVEEKIARIKAKAAKVAVKVATLATLATGVGAVSGCVETNDKNTDENKDKIENVQKGKTSVVFRTKKNDTKLGSDNVVLLENGDVLRQDIGRYEGLDSGAFLEPGDTVTYKGNRVKAVRYKDGAGKQVNFGKIGKIEEGR